MAYASLTIKDIVERSVHHAWSIPEFQRGFVWKTTQVRDLIESLWLGYPVGTLLVWDSRADIQQRGPSDGKNPGQWVVDGQQRTTALCILSGRKPYWWNAGGWDDLVRKYDIRFDVHTRESPFFVVANAATRKTRGSRYIPITALLNLDTSRENDQRVLQELAKKIKLDGLCDGMDAMEVYTRLDRIRKIRDKEIVTITVDNDLEDVVEIFSRLNSRGTRVREADIYLGVVAARAPGWVRDEFLPYLDELSAAGYDINPNLLFRTLTAIGTKHVRFKTVSDSFWDAKEIQPAWKRTRDAWSRVIKSFRDFGITGNALMPADNALVTTLALVDRFPDEPFDRIFYWFLQASRFGRYSRSSESAMEEDLREIESAKTNKEALEKLLLRLRYIPPIVRDDFLKDYADSRFGRLFLYLLIHRNQAIDWDKQNFRIGFDQTEILAGFQPQWHHIFPRKFLEGKVSDPSKIDLLANIAVIGPAINIRINARDPLDYIPRYHITTEKLQQQFIQTNIKLMTIQNYENWINERADTLSVEANRFLESYRGDLELPLVVTEDKVQDYAFEAA